MCAGEVLQFLPDFDHRCYIQEKSQAEIKDLKHTMDERPSKRGRGGKPYSSKVPNKKLISRPKNGENFSEAEKQTIAYRGYTFRN